MILRYSHDFFSFLVCQEAVPKSPIWVDAPDFTSDVLDQKPLEHSVFSHHGLFFCHLNPLHCSEETKNLTKLKLPRLCTSDMISMPLRNWYSARFSKYALDNEPANPLGPKSQAHWGIKPPANLSMQRMSRTCFNVQLYFSPKA